MKRTYQIPEVKTIDSESESILTMSLESSGSFDNGKTPSKSWSDIWGDL